MSRIYPQKRLGQNFLNSRHYAERIIKFANIKNDIVIEIGAGKGALTKLLEGVASCVYAVEVDRRLLVELRTAVSADTIILNQNFLKINFVNFKDPVIIGNIPYPFSTQIYEKLAYESDQYKKAVITVQKEFYDRLKASIGSKKYGPLSLMNSYFFDVIKGFEIPGRFFRPSPKVTSVVISLEKKKNRIPVTDIKGLFAFIKECFRYRRKTIKKHLNIKGTSNLIDGVTRRPQELSLDQWIQLYEAAAVNRRGYESIH